MYNKDIFYPQNWGLNGSSKDPLLDQIIIVLVMWDYSTSPPSFFHVNYWATLSRCFPLSEKSLQGVNIRLSATATMENLTRKNITQLFFRGAWNQNNFYFTSCSQEVSNVCNKNFISPIFEGIHVAELLMGSNLMQQCNVMWNVPLSLLLVMIRNKNSQKNSPQKNGGGMHRTVNPFPFDVRCVQ